MSHLSITIVKQTWAHCQGEGPWDNQGSWQKPWYTMACKPPPSTWKLVVPGSNYLEWHLSHCQSQNGPLNATRAADNSGDEGKYTLGRCPDDFRILFTFPRANDHPTVLFQTISIFNFQLFNSIFNFQDARTIFIFCTHSRELMRSPLIYFRLHLYIDAFSITIVHKFVIASSVH